MPNRPPHLISVIMPAYNAETYIQAAIESVCHQTYPHWELIIIDDASQDATVEVVARFSDPRIQYLRVSRIGSPSGVRNVGLRHAQGDYIAFLDADDLFYPYALESMLNVLQRHPDATAVHGFRTQIDETGKPIPHNFELPPLTEGGHGLPHGYENSWKNIVLGHIICTLPAFLLRRDTLERIGYLTETLCGPEDYEFIIRLFLDNKTGVYTLPIYCYAYRIHTSSLTKTPSRMGQLIQSHLTIMEWLFQQPTLPPEVRALKSQAYTEGFHYLGRECLIYGYRELTRQIVTEAFHNPHIRYYDWLNRCLQLWIRSYFPTSFDTLLIDAKHWWRNRSELSLNPKRSPIS